MGKKQAEDLAKVFPTPKAQTLRLGGLLSATDYLAVS